MSNSRLEKFIYAICSMEVSDLPAPLSRIEILWNCLITGETPDFEPQSRNEQYLMAMLGLYELENLPTPMSRGEKLLYKIAMGETDLSDIPAYLSRYEELLGYLAENGGVGDFEYILQTLNQRLSTLYSTKEKPMQQAIIKGDTLVNELPRPSLKNTMSNAASQKLNQGYNEKTLVNLVKNSDIVFKKTPGDQFGGTYTSNIRCMIASVNNINPNTKYLIKMLSDTKQVFIRFFNNSSNAPTGNTSWINSNTIFTTGSDTSKINLSFRLSENNEEYTDISQCSNILLFEYQDGMENWDIPYFEGTKTFSATPNVVDGEFKSAILKGNTLVNAHIPVYSECNAQSLVVQDGWQVLTTRANSYNLVTYPMELYKTNTDYLVVVDVMENNLTTRWQGLNGHTSCVTNISYSNLYFEAGETGRKIEKITTKESFDGVTVGVRCNVSPDEPGGNTIKFRHMIIEYQEGMENWNIPYFEGMQSVKMPILTTTGKNLFTGKNMLNGYYRADGIIDDFNHENSLSDYIKVEPSSSYAYKCFSEDQGSNYGEFAFFDENKNFINVLHAHHTSDTCIITPNNCHYLRVWNNQYINNGESHPNAMLVKTTSLPSTLIYEPYQSNTLTLAEPVTLRKVGDVEDEFDALTGQVTERVGEVVLDGSERWSESGYVSTNHYCAYAKLSKSKNIMSLDVICDSLPTKDILSSSKDYEGCAINSTISSDSGNFVIKIAKSKLSSLTANGLREYLSNNPMTLQYQLATPTTKQVSPTITDQDGATQTKLHSFNDGYLSVSSQGLLPSAVNYEVPTNNSYYLPDMLTLGAQYTSRGSADCHATIDGKLLALGKNGTFTTPSSVTDKLMVLDAPVDDLMFIKGDQTAKDFGYFERMKSVEMNGIQVSGKNLFDGEIEEGIFDSNGNPSNYVGRTRSKNFIKVPKNTDLYISIGGASNASWTTIYFYNDKKEYTETINSKDANKTFNTGNNSYIKWKNNTPMSQITNVQIEKGTVATSYEPYKSTTLTLNEPVTLRKVGEVQDTLDGLTGEVTERIDEIMLNESLNYQGSSSANGENTMYFQLDLGAYPNSIPVSSHFKVSSANLYVSTNDYEGIRITGSGSLQLRVLKSKLNSLNVKGLKEYLKQNNISLQYRLATESTKTIDLTTVDQDGQPTKLKTFNDITYVEINADNIIPSVDVEVATKINEALSTMGPQQLDISNTQNKLSQTIDKQSENTDATMMATTEIYEQTL